MRVIPLRPLNSIPPHPELREATSRSDLEMESALGDLLLGANAPLALPSVADILSAAIALAEGTRQKSILPLGMAPAELVLLRRGPTVLVSYYETHGAPEVRVLDRAVSLEALLHRLSEIATELAARSSEPTSRELISELAERARRVAIAPQREAICPVLKRGGAVDAPRGGTPLAFGYEARIVPLADPPRQSTAHSDAHALLFDGTLWMWTRDRRVPLVRGPIMLAIARMVAAARALVEAREKRRPANVRLRAGGFSVGVRVGRGAEGRVQLTLRSEEAGRVTIPELDAEEAALPILRLASDVIRAVISVDRSQTRNLRVSSLREEVRSLRRRIRARQDRKESVVCRDPDRLRAAHRASSTEEPESATTPSPRALRFEARWEAEVEGLDAASTFLCGDRLVVATPRQTVALSRDHGDVLWARAQPASASFMMGRVLARLGSDGRLALSDVEDGEAFAQTQLAPRAGGPPQGILAGGGNVPPVIVLAEGRDRLVAVDLRTGELRWRHTTAPGTFGLRRAGRILLCTSGDGTLSALDVVTGELLWRLALDTERFALTPAVSGDVVLAASGELGRTPGALFGVDLFSGETLYRRDFEAPPASAPVASEGIVTLAVGGSRDAALAAIDPTDGSLRWMTVDPGAAQGGACLVVDDLLVVNAPLGEVTALDLGDGRVRWRERLSHPVADDIPRRLEPILRGGALFVPSAAVHVLRPHDGQAIGPALPCELVPDWTRVDERGWVYVAEESGHLSALAPRATLTLVKS